MEEALNTFADILAYDMDIDIELAGRLVEYLDKDGVLDYQMVQEIYG